MYQPGTSTGSIAVTSGSQKVTGPGILLYANLVGGTTGNHLTVYDGTSTSGLLLIDLANVTAGVSTSANFEGGIVFNTGLYVVVSGSGSTGSLTYRLN